MGKQVILQDLKSYTWRSQDGFHLIGNPTAFPEAAGIEAASKYLSQQTTGFAWIFEDDKRIVAATDTARSIPLFYHFNGQSLSISNDIYSLCAENELHSFNRSEFEVFQKLAYVPGDATLIDDVQVLNPQEYLSFDKETCILKIEKYESQNTIDSSYTLEDVLDDMFDRLIAELNGRPAVIPLSAGYDSRLILAGLVQKGYPKIQAFTYGREGAYEQEIAKKVCEQLNISWNFVQYDEAIFDSYLNNEGLAYERYASQFLAVAHEQDYFALSLLNKQGLIPENSVIIPGFCADVNAGSQVLNKSLLKNYTSFEEFLEQRLLPKNDDSESKINFNLLGTDINPPKEEWQDLYEDYLVNNRLTKFIVNAVRAYEYFGYTWQLPFWSTDFISFWKAKSYNEKFKRKLYNSTLKAHYFKPLEIDFDAKFRDKLIDDSSLLQKVKELTPDTVKPILKRWFIPKNEMDVNNLMLFAQRLEDDEPIIHAKFKDENQAHAAWYLQKLQNGKKPFLSGSAN